MESQVAPGGGTVDHEPRAARESADAEEAADRCLTGADDSFGFSAATSWSLSGELPAAADLGGVTILRLLAEGGMGRVYEARQEAPRRIVAVKVIREGVVSAATSSRFLREAETLALLRHPHIAQIHTYGTAPAAYGGVPFFVMEMVENARPITRYAAVHGLSIRARIRLFLTVCEAVAHGHAHGVVHRDLKPANILVDERGEPKLIDFGIALGIGPTTHDAEAGDPPAAAAVDRGTAAGGMGTLRYMSPEQVLVPTAGPDTRSDVYALGLVLHELVTGRLPYDLAGLSLAEARRVLGSTAAPATAAVERAVAAQESRDEGRTLAVIAATCLEPRAAERYAHAGEVAADLACWLDGRAIAARPPTALESLRRLARRHRIATAAVASLVATLAVATTAVTLLSVRLEAQRRTAEAARTVATAEAEAARRQLYASTVLLAAAARDNDNIADAAHLLERAGGLVGSGTAPAPIELACLAASCDDSLAVVPQSSPLVTAVAWSPDGKVLASGGRGGEIMVRGANDASDAASRCLATIEAGVWSIAFSPDGRVLAIAGDDGSVTLLDSRSGRRRAVLEGFRRIAYSVAFSADGDLVAAGSRDGTARLWEASTGRQICEFSGHTGTVYGVAFLPGGDRLVTGGQDGTVRIWNAETGETVHTLVGHTARVFDVAVAPDGATIASASEDGTVRLWDVDAGRETACLRHPIRVNALAYSDSPDSLATVASDGVVRVWDVHRGVEAARFRGHTAAAWSVAWAPRDGRIATGGADGTVRLWSPVGRPDVVPLGSRVLAVACAPDGDTVAVGVGAAEVRLCDARTLESRTRLEAAAGRVNGVAWSPAGDLLAAACDGGGVFVWEASSRERILAIEEHDRRVYCVAFSPDASRLASASEDHTVRVHSPRTGEPLGPSLKHPGRVFGVAFTSAGERLVTACEDRLVRIWDAATGVEAMRLGGHDRQVNWVAVSPCGERIASASSDGTVRLWRIADGSIEHVLKGSARQVWKVAFSPDGTRLAAAAADGDVHLWDVATGGTLLALRGHADEVWAVAFAPDGRSLFSGSSDGTLRLWGVGCREIVRRRSEAASGAATALRPR